MNPRSTASASAGASAGVSEASSSANAVAPSVQSRSGIDFRQFRDMDIRTQSALLAAIVGLALGVSMLLRPQRPRVLTLFGIFALSVGSFYLSQCLEALFPWS